MTAQEIRGKFYLGREHDLSTGETSETDFQYDSKDLTTHAVCVGMTGSGKTGLCISLLEEAALDGVPAIVIDPKGDLGNLLLAFPDLEPSNFRPWIDESAATRQGMTPDAFAADQATLWRNGLAKWGQGPERIGRYHDSVERAIYTPASNAGIPITILKSFRAPPPELRADADSYRERIGSTVSGVLALLGIDADPVNSREHIFLSTLLDRAWQADRDLDLPQLIREIQQPSFERVGIMDLDAFYSAQDRMELSMKLNNLLASPSFASWMEGEPLDVNRLFYTAEGRPRLSVLSIAHLDDAERMFFVTILLNEVLAWMRSQPGTSSLRAILYMDEVYGYFPPVGNPPSKRPMLTLLKQGRAFGLGCVLATQNPVDLDYKGLSNAGTWFLGRLQTERDKARVLDGLEGASAQAGSNFNKRAMEATLAGLGSRVFLMNNVHDDAPKVFHTRWALSYMRGPLTRGQIKLLMDKVRWKFATPQQAAAEEATAAVATPKSSAEEMRPLLSGAIPEEFVALNERLPDGSRLVYRPGLLGSAKLHFVSAKHDVDDWRECQLVQTFVTGEIPAAEWEGAYDYAQRPLTDDKPDPRATYAALPTELNREKSYAGFARTLKTHVYRTQTLDRWSSDELDTYSEPGEDEAAFRQRMSVVARERRDEAAAKLEREQKSRLQKLTEKVARYEAARDEQKSQFLAKIGGLLWTVLELILGGASKRRRSSSLSKARQANVERGQASRAQNRLDDALDELEELRVAQEREMAAQLDRYDPQNLEFDRVSLRPRKSDIEVLGVSLVWLPWRIDADGMAEPIY